MSPVRLPPHNRLLGAGHPLQGHHKSKTPSLAIPSNAGFVKIIFYQKLFLPKVCEGKWERTPSSRIFKPSDFPVLKKVASGGATGLESPNARIFCRKARKKTNISEFQRKKIGGGFFHGLSFHVFLNINHHF